MTKENSADWFTHVSELRNNRKVKALRTKFGITGYAVYLMILEYLTGKVNNEFDYSDIEFELLAGDFAVAADIIRSIVDYCGSITALAVKDGKVRCLALDEKLKKLYDKRALYSDRSKEQNRSSGKFSRSSGELVEKTPHIRLDKSITSNTAAGSDKGIYGNEVVYTIEHCLEVAMKDDRWVKANKATPELLAAFNVALVEQGVYNHNPAEYKRYFSFWKKKNSGSDQPPPTKKMII